MKPRLTVSRTAVELIKTFEGFRAKAARLRSGGWTIGYGHTRTAREGAQVSEADAELLLLYDILPVADAVDAWTFTALNQNQFDALTCLAFNIGLQNFRRSAVLRYVNEGSLLQAGCAFDLWRKAEFEGETIVVDALVRRRAAEKTLFLTPPGGFLAAPSPVLRPGPDTDGTAVPGAPPVALTAVYEDDAAALVREAEAEAPAPSIEPAAPSIEPIAAPQGNGGKLAEAVDALSARLESLMAEPSVVGEEPPLSPPAADPRLPEPTPELSAADVIAPFGARFEAPAVEVEAPFDARHERRKVGDADDRRPLALGVLGLVVFGLSIVWGFSARPAHGAGPMPLVIVLGLGGIGCIGACVYMLLSRYGDR
jgi:lysozyme